MLFYKNGKIFTIYCNFPIIFRQIAKLSRFTLTIKTEIGGLILFSLV